jgi:hypothetical protein
VAFRQRFIRESRSAAAVVRSIRSLIPARIDRLPWSRSQAVLGLPPGVGGLVAVFFAVDADGKSLEGVAPLSVMAQPAEAIFRADGPAESAGEQ